MSNFICPTCGMNNIDCGKQGYKTDKEVELEKQNTQLRKWCEEFNALDVAKENQQLKELLKECRTMIGQFEVDNPRPSSFDAIEMLIRIDNAIGEKK